MKLLRSVRTFVLALLAIFLALWQGTVAHADAGDEVGEPRVFIVSAPVIMFAVGVGIPVLNGLLTRAQTSEVVKGLLTAALSAVATLVVNATVADGTAVFTSQMFFTWLYTTAVALFTYARVWKPINVTSNEGGKLDGVGVK